MNWWSNQQRGSFNLDHYERVLKAKEEYEASPEKSISQDKQKMLYIQQFGRQKRVETKSINSINI
jgi:hypothetical protein